MLSGKYSTDQSEWKPEWRGNVSLEQVKTAEQLKPIAARLGCTLAQLALAWCCANPNISSVIMGFTRLSQLEDNLGALATIPLIDEAVTAEIDQVLGNTPAASGASTMAMVNLRRESLEAGGHWIEMATPKL